MKVYWQRTHFVELLGYHSLIERSDNSHNRMIDTLQRHGGQWVLVTMDK